MSIKIVLSAFNNETLRRSYILKSFSALEIALTVFNFSISGSLFKIEPDVFYMSELETEKLDFVAFYLKFP